jgi:hypothetical protein
MNYWNWTCIWFSSHVVNTLLEIRLFCYIKEQTFLLIESKLFIYIDEEECLSAFFARNAWNEHIDPLGLAVFVCLSARMFQLKNMQTDLDEILYGGYVI